ncbi:von Willebrand and RING finger domain-containing protein [Trichodelitschia bisporula]|uniref:von Willebrand and RING finger domain-containing protein n=1 Tax=Trichodelitschia bisporula TaxID=703511 RepID=A0A6G1HXE7_9PEZI|nr:von Willebrand and RING finger domain-containing protein [Trichodelitschia bisporula]
MAGVLDMERSRNRKDRTFVGSECAVCEENLEYTLRGERILQLSCGHVAHEACFYEHIRESESQYCPACKAPLALDTSRGGNVLDLEKLSYIVKSGTGSDGSRYGPRSNMTSPVPWDNQPLNQPASREPTLRPQRSQELLGNRERVQQHSRNDSATTGVTSVNDFAEPQSTTGRRHDYDVQSMETSLSSPRNVVRNPIPPPTVTVRSEFPTLTRSRQQQSLTCLITVEVMEGKWRPTPEDVRPLPPVPQQMGSLNEFGQKTAPVIPQRSNSTYESRRQLDEVTEELHSRVDNWHGLDFSRFGKLRLHGYVRVGKDQKAWQDLDCYLFSDMLICVRERKPLPLQESYDQKSKPKCTLKGSILIKKHLKEVETHLDRTILTLSLSVAELPQFHLQFQDRSTLEVWKGALLSINSPQTHSSRTEYDFENSGTDEDEYRTVNTKRLSSVNSSYGAAKSYNTAPTEYSSSRPGMYDPRLARPIHVPLDIVVVIPVSTSMQGLKISLLRDTLKFLVTNLGERDRMGLVTFGSSGGGVPIVSMTSKAWNGWAKVLDSVRPVGQKSLRADVVEGANVAMDLLMQRKSANPLSSILLISDSSTSDPESVDFVIQRAEAAKVVIHSFGLGLTHKPDTMIELSTRTKASYTYVKDWMMLRECVAGCLGSLQTTSHQNAKLKLRLPEGSPAKFVKISGALHITKRASGRDAEAALGDLRFGDKRDILVQLVITPDNASAEQLPQDHWGTIISDLESIGGSADQDEQRTLSVEEVPLIQADLTYGDILRDGAFAQLSRPSLLAITMLPASRAKSIGRPISPPIPPHPSIVQRRMELLTSDMLTRALMLVSKGQHDRAHHLLRETRSILKGLGKGNLPPLPTPGSATTGTAPPFPSSMSTRQSALPPPHGANQPTSPTSTDGHPDRRTNNSPPTNASQLAASPTTTAGSAHGSNLPPLDPTATSMSGHNSFQPSAVGIDTRTVAALDAELEASLEWISHPAIFGRDSRKAVLQAIGVISSQRGYTFRTPAESLWAERIKGIKRLAERSREWREVGDEMAVVEEG